MAMRTVSDNNRTLMPKHTNFMGWRVDISLSLLWMLSWKISIKQQQKILLKGLKILNNQARIGSIGLKALRIGEVLPFVTVVCKGSGCATLGDSL